MDTETGRQAELEQLPIGGGADYAWAPGADELLVRTAAGQGGDELWLVKPSGEPTRLAHPKARITGFGWSPNGAAVAYTAVVASAEQTTGGLLTVAVNGAQERVVYTTRGSGLELAAWWPDGKGVVLWEVPLYSASLRADGSELKSLRLDSGKMVPLGQSLLYPDWLAWTSDSELLWVDGSGRDSWANKRLAMADVSSGQRSAVEQPDGIVRLDPSYSSATDLVAFVQAPKRAPGEADAASGVAWAEARELWVARKDGSEARKLDGGNVASPMWSQDGGRILYLRGGDLYLVPAAGGTPVLVAASVGASGDKATYYGYSSAKDILDWHQDGRQ